MTRERFFTQALTNLAATSRTKKGVSDTSSSADKPALATQGAALADRATENVSNALETVWADRSRSFSSPIEMKQWVDGLAAQVSEGLLQAGQPLYRTWATKFAMQTAPDEIEQEMQAFCAELLAQLDSDPIATAAWVEHELDTRIHPFADGCGRTTKLVSAWVLARHDFPLPAFDTRERYLELAIAGGKAFEAYYRERIAAQKL